MTSELNISQWVEYSQKNLDESWDKDFQYWLDAGFSHNEAEIACFVIRLPLGGIPTKYKELWKRCLFLSEVEELTTRTKDDLSRMLKCAIAANQKTRIKVIIAAIKAKPDRNGIDDVIIRNEVIAAEEWLSQL